ncbi:hypothetical protein GEMRC1_009461 [Eukaryota sp. GEM-RC1]
MGRCKTPPALTASRLIAINKSGGGVRPITVGESVMRLHVILCFRRVKSQSIQFFRPFQYAIGIPDGTTCATLCSDMIFNQSEHNFLLNVDYKNAFNSIIRSSIFYELEQHVSPLLPFFKLMYGSPSDHIVKVISTTRGVKEGDPLGSFSFVWLFNPF